LERYPLEVSVAVGLGIIHTTNLDYFSPQHQSELFRLKGVMLMVGFHRFPIHACPAAGSGWLAGA
jgi:hypothetical protein